MASLKQKLSGLLETTEHQTTLPSGLKVTFRPFKVKEEKILLQAMESNNPKDMTNAIVRLLEACTVAPKTIQIRDLPTFDIEWFFLKLRAVSIGEKQKLHFKMRECPKTVVDGVQQQCPFKPIEHEIDLNTAEIVKNKKHTTSIKLAEGIALEMRYPSIGLVEGLSFTSSENMSLDERFKVIALCIGKIYLKDEVIETNTVDSAEVVEFLEALNQSQFQQIVEFFETSPKIQKKIKVKCERCGKEEEQVLEGLQSFFG